MILELTMDSEKKYAAMCVICRHMVESTEGLTCCPQCGNKGVPADPNDKSTLTMTNHEWRILFMWASQWAGQCAKSDQPGYDSPAVVQAIAREAKRQASTLPALSLSEEIQELATVIGTKAVLHQNGEETEFLPETKH
jgi:hypothetical protein